MSDYQHPKGTIQYASRFLHSYYIINRKGDQTATLVFSHVDWTCVDRHPVSGRRLTEIVNIAKGKRSYTHTCNFMLWTNTATYAGRHHDIFYVGKQVTMTVQIVAEHNTRIGTKGKLGIIITPNGTSSGIGQNTKATATLEIEGV